LHRTCLCCSRQSFLIRRASPMHSITPSCSRIQARLQGLCFQHLGSTPPSRFYTSCCWQTDPAADPGAAAVPAAADR
jgi:hypothetical protein